MLAAAFGAARQAAAQMGLGHQARAARQDEILQRPQLFIPAINSGFQALDFGLVEGLILRHRQLAAKVEQAVLAGAESVNHCA